MRRFDFRHLLLAVAFLLTGVSAFADEELDGVYAWVQGESTCYRLTDFPAVHYEGMEAVLSIDGTEQLRVDVSKGELMLTFGVYVPSTVTVTVTSALRGTFACPYPLDFTGLPVQAYVCTGLNERGNAAMKPVGKVPARTGLFISADAAGTYEVPVCLSADDDELEDENLLVGNSSGEMMAIQQHETIQSLQYTNYILQKQTDDTWPRFYLVNPDGNNVGDRHAYLQLPPQAAGVKAFVDIDLDDATPTDLDMPEANSDGTVRKEGKFIIGKRLIIIREGKQYDANGLMMGSDEE